MGAEAAAWSIETGGDLFGRVGDVPTVLLATKAGPAAQRDHAHFRLDVEYLRQLSGTLAARWGLRYFGDWHSHHRLGLESPSSGDRRRIANLGRRNAFDTMWEMILTLEDRRGAPLIRVRPWVYHLSARTTGPEPLELEVVPGVSPVREALMASGALPEQDLAAWESVSLDRIRLSSGKGAPVLASGRGADKSLGEQAVRCLTEELERASGGPIEEHATPFGFVLVAHLEGARYLGLALSSTWPLPVLEAHRLDRDTGANERLHLPSALNALMVPRVIAFFESTRHGAGAGHVDE